MCNCCHSAVCYNTLISLCIQSISSVCLTQLTFYIVSGDRTPKQKVKLKVTEEKLLNLMLKYNGGRPRSEAIIFISISFFSFVRLNKTF